MVLFILCVIIFLVAKINFLCSSRSLYIYFEEIVSCLLSWLHSRRHPTSTDLYEMLWCHCSSEREIFWIFCFFLSRVHPEPRTNCGDLWGNLTVGAWCCRPWCYASSDCPDAYSSQAIPGQFFRHSIQNDSDTFCNPICVPWVEGFVVHHTTRCFWMFFALGVAWCGLQTPWFTLYDQLDGSARCSLQKRIFIAGKGTMSDHQVQNAS